MKKPIKPVKPSKKDKKPSDTSSINSWVCIDENEKIFLHGVEYNRYGYIDDYFGDFLYYSENMPFEYILEIHNLLDSRDFTISPALDYGSFSGWLIEYKEKNPDYEKQLTEFDKRFERYEDKLKKYETEMASHIIFGRRSKRSKN